jgi:precorrin-6Y C5,15-methyltransferase (decarboxylating)
VTRRWLSLIGVGEDGALSSAARALIDEATLVVGGARHLALVGDTNARRLAWPSPLTDALPELLSRRGQPTVVLATGDPFHYGVGTLLSRHIAPDEIFCLPAPSAFSLAAARLCWSLQDCALLSLHGRAFERVTPHLQPGRRLIALSWDGATASKLAVHLVARGFGGSTLHVLENLGGPHERIRSARADEFALVDTGALNTIAVELRAEPGARVLLLTPGLPDDWFEHDGQLTKRDVRAVTLAALAPRQGETLWDVGAGSGSIGIEWMLCNPANRTIAIERDAERAARVVRNATELGVPEIEIVVKSAPEAFAGLAPPDAIFFGGGATAPTIDAAWAALPSKGRIVVNAVTLETQALLAQMFEARGGELVHIQIAKARPVGRFHALGPAMPVLQWRASKS